jgi:tetratricopeptide (TPR) repeat protein
LIDLLYEELSPSQRASVESHLEQCAECRTALEEMRFALKLTRKVETPQPSAIPTRQILAAARQAKQERSASWNVFRFRPAYAAGIGFVFAVSLMLYNYIESDKIKSDMTPLTIAETSSDKSVKREIHAKSDKVEEFKVLRKSPAFAPAQTSSDDFTALGSDHLNAKKAENDEDAVIKTNPVDAVKLQSKFEAIVKTREVLADKEIPEVPLLLGFKKSESERDTKEEIVANEYFLLPGLESEAKKVPQKTKERAKPFSKDYLLEGDYSWHDDSQPSSVVSASVSDSTWAWARTRLFSFGDILPCSPDLTLANRLLDGQKVAAADSSVVWDDMMEVELLRVVPAARSVHPVIARKKMPAKPKAKKKSNVGEIRGLREGLEKVKSPSMDELHVQAQNLLRMESPVGAEKFYRQVIENGTGYPHLAHVYVELGDICFNSSRYDKALENYQEARKLPSSKSIFNLKAKLEFTRRRMFESKPSAQPTKQ